MATPTGAWAAQPNRRARQIGEAWLFDAPFVGLTAFDAATFSQRVWTSSACG